MFNLIKQLGIGVVDLVNNALDPYDDFTRPFLPPDSNIRLRAKAERFVVQLMVDFKGYGGLFLYNRPAAGDTTADYGDQAVHHGLATAALAFGHAVEQVDADDVHGAAAAIGNLFWHEKLIRGVDPIGPADVPHLFADDASNDTATGALCGIYFAARYGATDSGCEGIENIRKLADELIANGYALVRQDGTPTTYGRLINGVLTDPQRASLALAIFRAAASMTGAPIYHQHFAKLNKAYGALLRFADFKFLDLTKSYEPHRSAIHLHILGLEAQGDSDLVARVAGGLARIWKLHRKQRDPWIAALVNRFWRIPDHEMADVVRRLHEYPVDGKPAPSEKINSADAGYWKDRGVKFIKVGDNLRSSQPLPYHRLPAQDFWPQRHPYMCDGFAGARDTFVRHNAADFLAPYFLLRLQKVIGADE
jgi:hypothetical protein